MKIGLYHASFEFRQIQSYGVKIGHDLSQKLFQIQFQQIYQAIKTIKKRQIYCCQKNKFECCDSHWTMIIDSHESRQVNDNTREVKVSYLFLVFRYQNHLKCTITGFSFSMIIQAETLSSSILDKIGKYVVSPLQFSCFLGFFVIAKVISQAFVLYGRFFFVFVLSLYCENS